ncbi:hypothetical protein CTAYLR_008575 [Chrysophaeum taylorii]|uniref:cytochrome-b5 reductase n=1 Tax=Chrysophaeum taylorii TaxID=2483200 RepID=A0AAD7UHA6_9STRA|nr:hypothetical protein CTAYLR_008575 [Chrysophaeum taylorii]
MRRFRPSCYSVGGTTLDAYNANRCDARTGEWVRYRVQSSRRTGDSRVITCEIPDGRSLGACVIAGLKIRALGMDKSYSPISHPELRGRFDLLVKPYSRGLGAHLCSLDVGDCVECKLKPARDPLIARNRFSHVGMVANGTGVAPFVNVLAALLDDSFDHTRLSLVVTHSSEDRGLLVDDLEELAARHERFNLTTIYTESMPRIDAALLRSTMPPPVDHNLVLVCGTDAFVAAVAGPITRVRDDDGRKRKLQGPTLGFLGSLGYEPRHVFKL